MEALDIKKSISNTVSVSDFYALESRICNEVAIDETQIYLKKYLSKFSQNSNEQADLEGVLFDISRQPARNKDAAIVLLRCLSVPNLIPLPNQRNKIGRSIVELCEGAVPAFVEFLDINSTLQGHQKYDLLSSFHDKVIELLIPLSTTYGDLDALLGARKRILGCLNDRVVQKYATLFGLNQVKESVELIFRKLEKVSLYEPSFLTDVKESQRAIVRTRNETVNSFTFLKSDFLQKFLDNCDKVIEIFLESSRARFATKIVWNGTSDGVLQKNYPLHEEGREFQLVLPLRNVGPGLAVDVRVSVEIDGDCVLLDSDMIILGDINPNIFSVPLDILVMSGCKSLQGMVTIEWAEIGDPERKSAVFEFSVNSQSSKLDWATYEHSSPYSESVAKGDEFVGRGEIVEELSAKLLRQPMESFCITGQKRVGKTSLAIAVALAAKKASEVDVFDGHYILWGDLAHVDPKICLKQMGESIESFMIQCIPDGEKISPGDYTGSLSPLIKLANYAFRKCPHKKFSLILDEFDEMHQEMFIAGNLAETFFSNLRALSRCENICLILVGGENMPFIMDRQGQKLNNFSISNVSYFSREKEWGDFQTLVRKPTADLINWHEDAVSEVFNVTKGNPYFAKIVCSGVFRKALTERDADVTSNEVKAAVENLVSTLAANSFAHLWHDGIPKFIEEREPDILRRMRVLVALTRCMRSGKVANRENILNHRATGSLSEREMILTLRDFVKREVLMESEKRYNFALPIFFKWLADSGVSQLISDAINEELASPKIEEEEAAIVTSAEVVELAGSWPTYRGKHIGTDDIRSWYQQVDNPKDQRILFKLLKRTKLYTEALVRERLEGAFNFIRSELPEFVRKSLTDKRGDVIVTFVDGEGKSGAIYAKQYAEENKISADCVVASGRIRNRINEHIEKFGIEPAAIIIIDDIAATGASLSKNFDEFFSKNGDILENIRVQIVTLVSTEIAQQKIEDTLKEHSNIRADFRTCEVISENDYAFYEGGNCWDTTEEEEQAKYLCRKIGGKIFSNHPLGYGELGLLIVFPTTVPNNSLPILHSQSDPGSDKIWKPLFPRDFL